MKTLGSDNFWPLISKVLRNVKPCSIFSDTFQLFCSYFHVLGSEFTGALFLTLCTEVVTTRIRRKIPAIP
jgi:hypothetical protein